MILSIILHFCQEARSNFRLTKPPRCPIGYLSPDLSLMYMVSVEVKVGLASTPGINRVWQIIRMLGLRQPNHTSTRAAGLTGIHAAKGLC